MLSAQDPEGTQQRMTKRVFVLTTLARRRNYADRELAAARLLMHFAKMTSRLRDGLCLQQHRGSAAKGALHVVGRSSSASMASSRDLLKTARYLAKPAVWLTLTAVKALPAAPHANPTWVQMAKRWPEHARSSKLKFCGA